MNQSPSDTVVGEVLFDPSAAQEIKDSAPERPVRDIEPVREDFAREGGTR